MGKKDLIYPVRGFRLANETYFQLQELKEHLSWNNFFLMLVRKEKGIVCEECGYSGYLEIHHIIATKDGGTNEPENLKYLCLKCHSKTSNWRGRR